MTKILIADDIPENLYMLATILKAKGHEVVTAANGSEAYELGQKDPPGLIITDILMPVMDGFELCRLWKSNEKLKLIPFVFYTATYTDKEDEQFALSLGAERFIIKPQDPEVLVKIVQEILEQFKKGELVPSERLIGDEMDFLQRHSEVLRRKIEKKVLQLELEAAERKRAEQQLRDHAELLDNAHEAITRVDMDSKITYWNKGSERLYGWKSEEIVGKKLSELPFKLDLSQLQIALKMVKEKGEWHDEVRHIARNGREIVADSSWKLVYDDAGKPESILIINADITDKKKLEAQFLRAQRLENIGTLTSGIAHDLTNMLTPIKLAVENLRLRYPGEQGQELLGMIERNALRGADLIKRVLSFARGIEEEHKDLRIPDILNDLGKLVQEAFPKSIDIRLYVTRDVWAISGNATQLHQVLMNLCVNARDAMPEGGVLTINAENVVVDEEYAKKSQDAKVGNYVAITVSDTGIGMPPAILGKLFEPFFTTKEVGKGTGLGLSTSLGIVKGHRGFILVQSEVGKGTSFKVHLPAIKVPVVKKEPRLNVPEGHEEMVLVVDPEASTREVTCSALTIHGYDVLVASNGSEAISMLSQNQDRVAVILIDIMMPIVDGMDTIRIIQGVNPNVKIIAVGWLKGNEKKASMSNKQVKAFLPRPFTAETLLKTIHDVIYP